MSNSRFLRARTVVFATAIVAMLMAGLTMPEPADAAGPPYDGPQTTADSPAFFGPAPNPFPYCDNPTYFDPFPENVNPIGRIDPTGAPNASVTTNGVTMTFEITQEGSPDSQYPGFFPANGEGGSNDRPKGVEMQGGDEAIIRLSEPLFYTQWVFTDVDRANEGFFVSPQWTSAPGQIAIFGGDADFSFAGSTSITAAFSDDDQVGKDSEDIAGRVQVDMLGAVQGIDLVRDIGSGQSGFAIGGGCEPLGVSKELTEGPVWNGTSFDVTYTIRVRNNLPSTTTIGNDVLEALTQNAAAGGTGDATGTPVGIDLTDVTLQDSLADTAFSSIVVVANDSVSGNVATNDSFDGLADIDLLAAGEVIPPETEEAFTVQVQYVPDAAGPLGDNCMTPYQLLNQAEVGGVADGVAVVDLSDDGADPDPGVINVPQTGVDDPTPVDFGCPPETPTGALDIVKTVLPGADAACPAFAAGADGEGAALSVDVGDTVTYCIAVQNTGNGEVTDVVVTDDQAPAGFDGAIGTLAGGAEDSVSFNLVVAADTPTRNVAGATGVGPDGATLPEVTDPANIELPAPTGGLDIVKTVLPGADAACPAFAAGADGEGAALSVDVGDTVTYCIAVQNTGNGEVTDVVVTDDQAPAGFDGAIGTLAGGAEDSVSFNLVVAADTPTRNVAGATGVGPDGVALPEVTDPANINPTPINPQIALSKTVLPGTGADCAAAVEGVDELTIGVVGDPITWCFVVTNVGDVPLTNVTFNDGPAGITGRNLLEGAASPVLAVNESLRFAVDGVIPEGGIQNIANVVAEPSDASGNVLPFGGTVEAENPAAINEAAITLSKTVAAGANADCATAVELVTVNAGTQVTYCFTVTNTGEVTVRVPEVIDATLGITVAIAAADQDIAPGTSVTVSATVVATGDLLNTASSPGLPIDDATGEPIPGFAPLVPTDTAEVDTLEADLSLTKSNNGQNRARLGQDVGYTLVVTNDGPDPAVNVQIVDSLPTGLTIVSVPELAGWTCSNTASTITCDKTDPLAANTSETLTYIVNVNAEAPLAEQIVNTATVTSDTPDPDPTDNEDTEFTTRVPLTPSTLPDEPLDIVVITNPPGGPSLPTVPVSVPASPPLAVTGGLYNGVLVIAAAAMTATGGVFLVSGRRAKDDQLG